MMSPTLAEAHILYKILGLAVLFATFALAAARQGSAVKEGQK